MQFSYKKNLNCAIFSFFKFNIIMNFVCEFYFKMYEHQNY